MIPRKSAGLERDLEACLTFPRGEEWEASSRAARAYSYRFSYRFSY